MRKLIGILSVVVLFASCNKDNPTTSSTAPVIISISPTSGSSGTLVYIKGTHFNSAITLDSVKFNGVLAVVQSATDTTLKVLSPLNGTTGPVSVTVGNNSAVGPIFTYTVPNALYTAFDSGIYIAGDNGGSAVYWKNGVSIGLETGGTANAIAIVGNDLYIAGAGVNSYGRKTAKYWKNGIAVILASASTVDIIATSIAIDGNDIYVTGNSSDYATLWKNGTAIQTWSGNATSVVIVGKDVYVAGYQYTTIFDLKATYWKNGIPTDLTNGVQNARVLSMAVIGNDVYLAGAQYGEAKYWKNNTNSLTLSTAPNQGEAYGIGVLGADVYVVGWENGTGTNDRYAKYWKNGIGTILSNKNASYAYTCTIVGNDVYIGGEINGIATYWKNGVPVTLNGEMVKAIAIK